MSRSSRRVRAGFTLLEVMLAVIILGLLLTTVYGAVTRTMRAKEFGEERAELFAVGRDVVLRIADDIEGALLPKFGVALPYLFRGRSSGGSLPADTLEFVMMNRGGYGVNRVCPGPVLVRYSLEPVGERRDLFMLRRDEDSWDALVREAQGIEQETAIEEATTPEEEIAPCAEYDSRPLLYCHDTAAEVKLPGSCIRVVGLRFRYYDNAAGAFRDEWDSTQEAVETEEPPGTGSRAGSAAGDDEDGGDDDDGGSDDGDDDDDDDEEVSEEGRLPVAVEISLYLADERGKIQDFTTVVDIPLGLDQPTPTSR